MSNIDVEAGTQTILIDQVEQTIVIDPITLQSIIVTGSAQSIDIVSSGLPGPQGLPGTSPTTYTHTQGSVSSVWNVTHDLGYKPPGVTVIDSGGNTIEGDVFYVDDNNLTISFDTAFSGIAIMI